MPSKQELQRAELERRIQYYDGDQGNTPTFGNPQGRNVIPTLDVPPELLTNGNTKGQVGLKKRTTPDLSFMPNQQNKKDLMNEVEREIREAEKSADQSVGVEQPVIASEMDIPFNPNSRQIADTPIENSTENITPVKDIPQSGKASPIQPGKGRRSALIPLPSRGLYYDPNKIETINGNIRSFLFSGREEIGFAGTTGDYLKVIDAILGSCLNSDTIAQNLIVGDRLYALIAIRAHTYGAQYQYKIRCASCGRPFINEVNLLEDLPIDYAQEDWGPEPFTIELPISHDIVSWRMLRGFDEMKVNEYVTNFNEKYARNRDPLSNPEEECRNALIITSVNGEDTTNMQSFSKKIRWLKEMDGLDMSTLRTAINEREPGIRMSSMVTCPSCGYRWEAGVRLTAEFFRPKLGVSFKHTKSASATR